MSEILAKYQRALDGFDGVISKVPADRWENQSPCAEWKARDVAGHVIANQRAVRTLASGDQPPRERPSTRAAAGEDPAQSWREARSAAAEELTPEALARVVPSPFGEMPLEQFLNIFMLDVLAHTWDLARATDLAVALDPELVRECFERVRPLDEGIRRPGLFDPKIEAPAGCGEQEALMAFLGRQV
ncbi:MAG: TIGR03086 family metal-binding protein [Acidimicrobiales bacterium]